MHCHRNCQDAERVNALIKECRRDPLRGTDKPEPLGGNLTGF
ncbi:MAG: type II toxin-antitoxin system YoeB family toxin [Alphaproteobacteria bacterium]|nr:type II toxin-antitoxin system YoeB family toxin [Alphaproteobacteria bacterium]